MVTVESQTIDPDLAGLRTQMKQRVEEGVAARKRCKSARIRAGMSVEPCEAAFGKFRAAVLATEIFTEPELHRIVIEAMWPALAKPLPVRVPESVAAISDEQRAIWAEEEERDSFREQGYSKDLLRGRSRRFGFRR